MRALAPAAVVPLLLAAVLAGCGDPAAPTGDGVFSASGAEVLITGQLESAGTRGSVLVFAFPGTIPPAALAGAEPASVAVVTADGEFTVTLPSTDSATLAFLADGSNDGVIDGGDPLVVLADPRLDGLHPGDSARITGLSLDFRAGQAVGAEIEVQRAGGEPVATVTPTAIPQG